LELGFDYCFLIPATGDRVPCVYVENRHVVDLEPQDPMEVSYRGPIGDEPTGASNPELLKMRPSHGHNQTIVNGISRIGYMRGGKAARWVDENMADRITEKAVRFIEEHDQQPFFLYFSTHDIHVPRVPHARFVGHTEMGPRGDVIVQLDWCVGQILQTLRQRGLTENTLVLFTSDNGPVVDDGYRDEAVEKLGNHRPAGSWRGGKYSNFEGGTRVPWIVSWPGRVPPGRSSALICQVDLLASLAALVDQGFDATTAPDSQNVLPALLGDQRTGRDHLVEQAQSTALRQGSWKYIPPSRGAKLNRNTNTELGNDPSAQLYDLERDPAEANNVAAEQRAVAEQLDAQLQSIRQQGR
jgi:arylsulfatase A-like enzyme